MIGTPAEKMENNRADLVQEFETYRTDHADERACVPKFLELLKSERCFHRDHFDGTPKGHITGSALLLNPLGDKILMNHHKSLNKWLSFGGHADGEEDILSVAIRETMEESGITAFKPWSSNFIDIDIHLIPENKTKNEPAHSHYDIRYIMQMTADQNPILSDESISLKWMTFDEALSHVSETDSITRLIKKAEKQ